jgi:hypothetical protein
MTTSTTTEVGTTVCFTSKAPHTTLGIEIHFPEGVRPEALFTDLAAIGFVEDGLRMAPPLDGIEEAWLSKRGSGLFAGWTPEEKKAFTKEARAVLRRHGFNGVPHNKLSWQDLL